MKNRKGFTIVELVIVIAVIAILAAVLIPTFSGVIGKANASAAQQTATNALKAGLLMTNTATLPADSLVLVDSDKNANTQPDYGYVYNGNALELKDVYMDDGKTFKTSIYITGPKQSTILVSSDFASAKVENDEVVVTPGKAADLLLSIIAKATGKTLTDSAIKAEKNEAGEISKIYVELVAAVPASGEDPAVPAEILTVFTSVDMPANVVIFVPMG